MLLNLIYSPSFQLSEDLSGMKIGLLQEGFSICERDVIDVVRASGQSLTKAGATVEDVSVPLHKYGREQTATYKHYY